MGKMIPMVPKDFTVSGKIFCNAIVEFKEWLTATIIYVERFLRGVKTLLWITQ